MEDVLWPPGQPALPLSVLLDDVATQHDDVGCNLDDAAEAVLRITRAGAMVSPAKCKFAVKTTRHLGDKWTSGGYWRPPDGKISALLELDEQSLASMPRAQLFGMLGYWRDYVPDFAARTQRLRHLLRGDAAPWTPAHTEEFRATVQALVDSAPMINFDPQEPVVLETHTGPKGLAAVYLQQDPAGGRWLPVAAYSRPLTATELGVSGA